MADEPRDVEAATSKTRQGAEQAAALDRMTDVTEERELKAADTSQIKQKMAALAERQKGALEAQRQKEKEYAAVKINPDDVKVLANQFEIDAKKAERQLRIAGGDLKKALQIALEV